MPLNSFYIVDRQSWGAVLPKVKKSLERPILFVKTTVLSEERKCYTEDECFEQLRDMQQRHMASGLTDIGPNFLIADDGRVYEGRGWFNTPPDHPMPLFNPFYLEIAHLGGSPGEEFRDELIQLRIQLLEYGMKKKYISKFHSMID